MTLPDHPYGCPCSTQAASTAFLILTMAFVSLAEEDPAEAAAAAELQQPAGQGRKAKRRG